ncbi:hypothetical protein KDL01_01515 [Actinospica durhamensis]|uniref:Transmembrane transport protein n=1 Tax=Actinospica durhamensis TaxID=1508375 RepID=A0A941EI55_9ACTN|nr:hypothetical protein [Actinospica durhamensis]MBR7831917.1 hypothetical protein [Actinospica durhamensis]
MIWLTWRQFRTQTYVALVLLAAAAAYLLISGHQLHHSYTVDLATCQTSSNCSDVLDALQSQYNGPLDLVELLLMAVPALIGIFWGAPLIAAELERGTHYTAWHQSVTRTRWLAVKLTLVGFASVLTAGVLSLLVTWWTSPLDTLTGNRFGIQAFNARDITPLGYAAFAFVLGAVLGLLFRRAVPAMAATIAIFIAVQILVSAGLRPHLLPATTVSLPINQTTMSQAIRFDRSASTTGPVLIDLAAPAGAWDLSQTQALGPNGQPIQTSAIISCWSQMAAGPGAKGGPPDFSSLGACLAPQHLHVDMTYQPAYRYWQLQWMETAFYTVLAALLAAVCFRRIRRVRG